MEIREGYKQTEIGVIPEDWDYLKAEDCVSIKTGSRNTVDKQNDGVYPFFVRSQQVEKINSFSFDCEAVLTAGDGVGTGKVFHYINGKFDVHQRVYVMNDFKNILGKYFYYYFSNYFYDEVCKYTAKSSVDSVRRDMVAKMLLPIPPIPEQQAIATALSDIDGLINSLQKLIDKKKKIKQGAMQELLTGKRRLEGFRGEWVEVELGTITKINTGKRNNEDKVESGKYPFFVRSKKIERIDTYSFEGEAIIVPGEGNIGDIFHYVNGRFDFHQRVYKISNFSLGIYPKYVYYYMINYFGEYALRNTVKATVDSLRLPTFQKFILKIPPTIEEQTAIANILSDMDREIEALERKLNKYKDIKQGMMQELLTGRIRLLEEAVP
jgi:type I restriction enzyme S subunit